MRDWKNYTQWGGVKILLNSLWMVGLWLVMVGIVTSNHVTLFEDGGGEGVPQPLPIL